MPSTSENGVFISLPSAGIRPAASQQLVEAAASMSTSATQPCSLSRPFQA